MEKVLNFIHHGLNTYYLKMFRNEANNRFKVWKRDNGYFVAVNAISLNGMKYAEETIPFGEDHYNAKKKCNELRSAYILHKVKEARHYKTVY